MSLYKAPVYSHSVIIPSTVLWVISVLLVITRSYIRMSVGTSDSTVISPIKTGAHNLNATNASAAPRDDVSPATVHTNTPKNRHFFPCTIKWHNGFVLHWVSIPHWSFKLNVMPFYVVSIWSGTSVFTSIAILQLFGPIISHLYFFLFLFCFLWGWVHRVLMGIIRGTSLVTLYGLETGLQVPFAIA